MQAVILAAGMGKRLGDLTQGNTKCMIKVNGVTLIDRMLTQLAQLDLNKIIIVVGYRGEDLKEYIGNVYNNIQIEYVFNPIYDKTNNIYSLYLAKDHLLKDDTLLLESDIIMDDGILPKMVADKYPDLAIVAKYESWMDGTMVTLDADSNIVSFVPKKLFNYSDIDQYYKTVNIYKFGVEFSKNRYIPFLEAYSQAFGNNEYYEQVLRVLSMMDKEDLKALPLGDEKWYEIDDVQDLDIAETIFAGEDDKLMKYQKRYGGYWRFDNLLDFCYLVNPFFPTERLKNEIRSNFDILLSEYPSGLSVNNLLAGKYFGISSDYVCVGNGAAELIKGLMNSIKGQIGIIYPTFEEYPNRIDEDRIIQYTPDNVDFAYTVSDLIKFFENETISDLLLINPDNPSGNYISHSDLLLLIEWTKKKRIELIIDESFIDFAESSQSLLENDVLEENPHLIVIKSISKSYGVPGLRLGVLATSNKQLLDSIKKELSIWNINSFAEFYMQIFGKYASDYKKACSRFVEERARFYNCLQGISWLRIIPSQANYFLCEITNKYSSADLTRLLLSEFNILIKDCGPKYTFQGKNYIRIAVRGEADNNRLLDSLKKL